MAMFNGQAAFVVPHIFTVALHDPRPPRRFVQRASSLLSHRQAVGDHLLPLLLSTGLQVLPGASAPPKLHNSCMAQAESSSLAWCGAAEQPLKYRLVRREQMGEVHHYQQLIVSAEAQHSLAAYKCSTGGYLLSMLLPACHFP